MTTLLKLKFLRATALACYYEHPQTRRQQWVPRTVCGVESVKPKAGEIVEVRIDDWWLKQNPFVTKADQQEELF